MARYGMDYDRGFRGSGDYARDYREGGDWNRDQFTSGTRQYNAMHNDWHINRDHTPGAGRGWAQNRPRGGYGNTGYGAAGGQGAWSGYGRTDRNLDEGGYGEAGWSGWSGSRGPAGGYGSTSGNFGGQGSWGGYGSSSRGLGVAGNRGYDVEDYQRFSAGSDRGFTGGGRAGGLPAGGQIGGYSGGYMGGGYSGGGYMGSEYTRGLNRGNSGYGAAGWSRDYGSDFTNRGYDHDMGDRVRDGWDHLRDRARNFFRR